MWRVLPTINDKARFLAFFAKLMPERLLSIRGPGWGRNNMLGDSGLGTGLDELDSLARPCSFLLAGPDKIRERWLALLLTFN